MNELTSLSRMARRLGVTRQWLRDQAEAGKIPCLDAGNRYLFNPEAVQEALAEKGARTRQGGDRNTVDKPMASRPQLSKPQTLRLPFLNASMASDRPNGPTTMIKAIR